MSPSQNAAAISSGCSSSDPLEERRGVRQITFAPRKMREVIRPPMISRIQRLRVDEVRLGSLGLSGHQQPAHLADRLRPILRAGSRVSRAPPSGPNRGSRICDCTEGESFDRSGSATGCKRRPIRRAVVGRRLGSLSLDPQLVAKPTEEEENSSACGHASPRTSKSEGEHHRKNAAGVGPRRQWKKVGRLTSLHPA